MDESPRALSPALRHQLRSASGALIGGMAGVALISAGCSSPLADRGEAELRRSILQSVERQLAPLDDPDAVQLAREDRVEALGLSPERIAELDGMSGPSLYTGALDADELGSNLVGEVPSGVPISLGDSVLRAVQNNLAIQSSRINPAVRESQLVQAEAAFDWVFSSSIDWQDTDQPIQTQTVGGGVTTAAVNSSQSVSNVTGLARQLTTGGRFSISQRTVYSDNRTTTFGSALEPDPGTSIDLTLDYAQPLLEGFGSDVALAQVRLSRNAEREAIAQLKSDLIDLVTEVEAAYWRLDVAQRTYRIQNQLLARGVEVRDQLRERIRLDATPAQVADAVSRVERRRAQLVRTRNELRKASDAFKALVNDPDLVIAGESVLITADAPGAEAIEFNLRDAIVTAVAERPDIERALLGLDNASIRQLVADNGRLPRLDLRASVTMASLADNVGDAYSDLPETEFFDNFLFGIDFEQAIGNRGDEALYRQRRLERMQAAVAYRAAVQDVVLSVKNALNDVRTNYTLIEQSRTSRLAAAEVLRALLVEKNLIRGYSVERLDLELNRQEQLASEEISEAQAIADYNIAIAEMHRATGTSLYRSRIDFVVPDADQLREAGNPASVPIDRLPPEAPAQQSDSPAAGASDASADPAAGTGQPVGNQR